MKLVVNPREPQIKNLDMLPRMDRSLIDYKIPSICWTIWNSL